MQRYFLTIVFSKDLNKFLMCYNKKSEKFNFVGGNLEYTDEVLVGTYKNLFDKAGITSADINLSLVREEIVFEDGKEWHLYVTTGILNKNVIVRENGTPLLWIPVFMVNKLVSANVMGDGSCYTYYREACRKLDLTPVDIEEGFGMKAFEDEDGSIHFVVEEKV